MGPVAKTLTGWASSAFGGAGAAASGTAATATTAATTTGASTAASAAAAESAIAAGTQGINAASTLSEASLLAGENLATQAATTSAANQTVAGQIANATNNMDMANSAISAIDSAAITGSTNVSSTITESVIKDAIPAIEQNVATVKANVIEMGETITTAPRVSPMDAVTETIDIDASNLVAQQNIAAPKIDFTSDPTFIGEGISDTALSTPEPNVFAKGAGKLKDYATGEFGVDVAKGITTNLIMQGIAGEPEEGFRNLGVQSQITSEAAQQNYVQQMGPSAMAVSGLSNIPTFQQMAQQTMYGTGSPNYLSQFYQPLATPRMG
jgi:hypothetical protein